MTALATELNSISTLPFHLKRPIIQAPMAGGATTPQLISAVCEHGGLGSLGAGMTPPSTLNEQINTIKSLTDKAFSVNLMVLSEAESTDFSAPMPSWLTDYYQASAIDVDVPERPAESFDEQLQVLLENPVAVVSFTFGIITASQVQALHDVGSKVMGTANHPLEAKAWAEIGADMVCMQGSEAGGHRGGWLAQSDDDPMGLLTLMSQTVALFNDNNIGILLIGAGGIMTKQAIQAVLSAGASMAQIGTAFLTTHESGINPTYKAELLKTGREGGRVTRLTRLFSGKQARGLVNDYMQDYAQYDRAQHHRTQYDRSKYNNDKELPPYPQLNAMTKQLRANAKDTKNPEYLSLWAGQGVGLVREESVAELMKRLW